jgi:hypothetical protein
MDYAFLADAVVVFHCAYVAFVVIGQLTIWLGLALRWSWVRNLWFRLVHLVAIGVVAVEEFLRITCPLTVLENWLREQAGQSLAGESFMGRLAHSLIFHDLPPWVFFVANVGFGVLVLATFVLAPPRWPRNTARLYAGPRRGYAHGGNAR